MFQKLSIACTEQTNLAIIECSLHSDVMYICVSDGSHLRFLNGRYTTLRMKDENGDIGLVPESIDGGTMSSVNHDTDVGPVDVHVPACVSASRTDYGQFLWSLVWSFTSISP